MPLLLPRHAGLPLVIPVISGNSPYHPRLSTPRPQPGCLRRGNGEVSVGIGLRISSPRESRQIFHDVRICLYFSILHIRSVELWPCHVRACHAAHFLGRWTVDILIQNRWLFLQLCSSVSVLRPWPRDIVVAVPTRNSTIIVTLSPASLSLLACFQFTAPAQL